MIGFAATLCVAALAGTLACHYLRSADFSSAVSTICAALAAGQIVVALTTATMTALLLLLAIYPIAAGAAAFARVQSVRNVMLLSGSLALVQAVNPLGVVMAGMLAPVLIVLQDTKAFRSRGISLLVLLLFIPVGSATLLTYRAHTMAPGLATLLTRDVAQFAVHPPHLAFADFRIQALARAAELIAVGSPVWITAAIVRSRASVAIATVCAALIVAITVAALLGRPRPVALVAPALAMPSVLALHEWPRSRRTVKWVVAGPALGAFLTWFCAELAA